MINLSNTIPIIKDNRVQANLLESDAIADSYDNTQGLKVWLGKSALNSDDRLVVMLGENSYYSGTNKFSVDTTNFNMSGSLVITPESDGGASTGLSTNVIIGSIISAFP